MTATDNRAARRRQAHRDAVAILDALARLPYQRRTVERAGLCCSYCGLSSSIIAPLNDPARHEPSCLWRRAVEFMRKRSQ